MQKKTETVSRYEKAEKTTGRLNPTDGRRWSEIRNEMKDKKNAQIYCK